MSSNHKLGFLILTLFLCGFKESFCAGGEYSENCNDTAPCNRDHWLTCTPTGICDCENDTFWNQLNRRCQAIIGSDCQTEVTNSTLPLRYCIENAECWQNSPTEAGRCACMSEYLPTPSNNKCLLGHLTASCNSDSECNFYSLLRCREKRCVCDEENKIWNPISRTCACQVGKLCLNQTGFESCVDNSVLDTTSKTCLCSGNEFQETPTGECKLRHQQPCNSDPQCHPEFKCLRFNETSQVKVCQCDPTTENYDSQLDLCRVKAGQSCQTNKKCVKHSLCSEISNVCECSPEYEESAGHCVAGYGTLCRNNEMICNAEHNLVCNHEDWKCGCINGYHHFNSPKCLALPGTTCISNTDCYEFSTCVNNTDSTEKICSCKTGYSQTPDNLCALDHGQPCGISLPSTCNEYNFLSCDIKTQKCNCSRSFEMTYDENVKACQGKANQFCHTEEVDNMKLGCIPNAECIKDPSSTHGSCACMTGFYPNENGFCDTTAPGKGTIGFKSSVLILFVSQIVYYYVQ